MLDPHRVEIENWLLEEPHLTALAILERLNERYPKHFGPPQHSIVQRLLRSLRSKMAETIIADKARIATASSDVTGVGHAKVTNVHKPAAAIRTESNTSW